MCFTYIIKRNFVVINGHGRFYPIAYYIYVFGQCRCGFWLHCCCKTFEITEIIWRRDTEL